ncbi:MAG: hypothetical protein NVV74_07935 [Magnetospirillum sp.]|nr:hypothetical protein [Magnetospirillum sp.]
MRAALRYCGVPTLALLAACGQTAKQVPLTLTVPATNCAASPNLATAKALVMPEGKKSVQQEVDVATDAPCLVEGSGKARYYTVFALPRTSGGGALTASVSSPAQGGVVFAPRISVLGESGEILRDIPEANLMFRGNVLSAVFRLRPEERYLLVTSNPERVGNNFKRTTASVGASTVPVGTGTFTTYSGTDLTLGYTYSHTGKVLVSIDPLPGADS